MGVLRPTADEVIEDHPDLFKGRSHAVVPDRESSGEHPKPTPPSKAAKPRKPTPPWKVRLLRWSAWTGIAALLVPLAAGGALVGGLAAWLEVAPPIQEFDAYNPPEATTILDQAGKPVASLFEQRRFVVPLSKLPHELPEAFAAVEDERFRDHIGVDPQGIARAFAVNVLRRRVAQGASTITQQTARNLLPHIGTSKTANRKVQEMLTALVMEQRYSKDQIIEVYLNQIYLGSGTYGVEAAAQAYFGKPAAELTPWECATLAGLPQAPERYSPLNNPELCQTRRDQVLWKMLQNGVISDSTYNRAITEPLTTSTNRVASGTAPYFIDAVRRLVSRNPALGDGKLQTAGWKIRTTLDPRTQQLAERILREGLIREEGRWLEGRRDRWLLERATPEFGRAPAPGQVRMAEVKAIFAKSLVVELPGGWRGDVAIPEATAEYFSQGPNLQLGDGVDVAVFDLDGKRGMVKARLLPAQRLQGSLVVVDPKSGDVRALVGGREYNDRANNGFYNRAVQARRQAGSTFKPFFFAAALEAGLTPNSLVSDTPIVFGDGYAPRNYDRRFMGRVSLQYSLEHSRNIPTFRVVEHVGIKSAIGFVRQFQRTGEAPWSIPREWTIVLGTTNVTALELAAAYQAIANGGEARGPRLVESVSNAEDRETVGMDFPAPQQLLSPATNARLLQMMVGVIGHGTGTSVRERLPEELRDRVAGKSGTTDDNRDAWFAGFSPWEVVVVWMGFDGPLPLSKEQTGGKSAGHIWGDYMAAAWELKTPEQQAQQWELPEGMVLVQQGERNGTPIWRLGFAGELAGRERAEAMVEAAAAPEPEPIVIEEPTEIIDAESMPADVLSEE